MKKKSVFEHKNLLIILCLTILFSQKTHAMQHVNIDYPKAFQTVASLAAGIGAFALSTLIHECGHALMAKILLNSPLDINIGGYNEPKMKIGFFSLNGFNPFMGYAKTDVTNSKKIERILIGLAGPCAGASASLYFSTFCDNQIYKLVCCVSFIVEICNLYPDIVNISDSEQSKSDGGSILEECINKELVDQITSVLSNGIIKNVITAIITVLTLNKLEKLNFVCTKHITFEHLFGTIRK